VLSVTEIPTLLMDGHMQLGHQTGKKVAMRLLDGFYFPNLEKLASSMKLVCHCIPNRT
jgi:hypothetical protein